MSSDREEPLHTEAAGVLRARANFIGQSGRCDGYVVALATDLDDDSGDRIGFGGDLRVVRGLLSVAGTKAS